MHTSHPCPPPHHKQYLGDWFCVVLLGIPDWTLCWSVVLIPIQPLVPICSTWSNCCWGCTTHPDWSGLWHGWGTVTQGYCPSRKGVIDSRCKFLLLRLVITTGNLLFHRCKRVHIVATKHYRPTNHKQHDAVYLQCTGNLFWDLHQKLNLLWGQKTLWWPFNSGGKVQQVDTTVGDLICAADLGVQSEDSQDVSWIQVSAVTIHRSFGVNSER